MSPVSSLFLDFQKTGVIGRDGVRRQPFKGPFNMGEVSDGGERVRSVCVCGRLGCLCPAVVPCTRQRTCSPAGWVLPPVRHTRTRGTFRQGDFIHPSQRPGVRHDGEPLLELTYSQGQPFYNSTRTWASALDIIQ